MTGTHDSVLITLSVLIAAFASFTALSLASRVRATAGWTRRAWLAAAAIALGGGIWSMHFVAMLAFSTPGMSMTYDVGLTLLSLVVAVAFTGAGFALMNRRFVSLPPIIGAGLLMGGGVVAMHYMGMAAMRMDASLSYERFWLSISVLIAIGAATSAVWLASLDHKLTHRIAAAALMGAAIAGMHFAGMKAAIFTASSQVDMAAGAAGVTQTYLAVFISVITMVILLLALGAARLERLFEAYARREEVRAAALKEAEEARRAADTLYRAYFENTPDPLFVIGVTAEGGFVVEQVNPAHEIDVGFKLEEVRGKRVEEILPQDSADKVLHSYRYVVNSGKVYQYRDVFDLSGSPQYWDTTLVPLRDDSGRVVRVIGASRNVTAQVTAEEALRQSQKMDAMGQLTGGVAHDFNNLLTPIIGVLDRLQRKEGGDEREQRLIAGAAEAAERARTLVQRLLSFARRQPLQPVAVDLGSLVAGMSELVTSTTGPQIKVVVDAPQNLPAAVADANQLEMALLNLCVNARDAMPDGGTLSISVSADEVRIDDAVEMKPGRYLRLSVADTGAGMDERTLARAVEPFFSTKGVGHGTGLGLSMAHGLAAQLGGGLRIRSTIGVGTCVELWLPQSGAPAEPSKSPRSADLSPVTSARALLVDDEDLVRASTADMLEALGYTVRQAASAEEALEVLASDAPLNILVTDHLMPGLSGTELARRVLADHPETGVLVISGYAEAAGVDADLPTLSKPFRQAELAAKLREIIAAAARLES